MATTKTLAALPLTSSKWLSMSVHWTEVIPVGAHLQGVRQLRARCRCGFEQIGFSLAAVIGISATAGRIGGRRAGLIAAWIAALEPSSAYFGGLLHQESLCMVGEALLLAALVDVWLRDNGWWRPLLAGAAGLALIFGTRSYLAFFAGVAVVLVLVGSVLCRRIGAARGLARADARRRARWRSPGSSRRRTWSRAASPTSSISSTSRTRVRTCRCRTPP